MTIYCQHHDCRCETATELAWMSDVLHRADLLQRAVEVHSQQVRCRHVPRNGHPKAPLPLLPQVGPGMNNTPQPTKCHECDTVAAETVCHVCKTERLVLTALKNLIRQVNDEAEAKPATPE